MAGITVLADDIAELADVLKGVDDEFAAAARSLRDLTPEDVGPAAVAKAVTEVVARLERRLGALATEAGDGARVVRRQVTEFSPTADQTGPASPSAEEGS